jgi:hypothetical protein
MNSWGEGCQGRVRFGTLENPYQRKKFKNNNNKQYFIIPIENCYLPCPTSKNKNTLPLHFLKAACPQDPY